MLERAKAELEGFRLWLEALMLAVELQGYDRNCHMGVNGLLAAPSNRPP
jgi:hypothetical protein